MEIVTRSSRMRAISQKLREEGKRIGFVPTMGALHDGHLSLIRETRKMADVVVVSIFVNPTQFGPSEDFEQYPRDLARDADRVATLGVDYIFAPSAEDIYAPGFGTWVEVADLSNKLCGASRAGHFRGVCTVVSILFNVVRPHFAFFGQKDAQQSIIIKRMVKDLRIGVEIVVCPTVREIDGLAVSSRNAFLNPEERQSALCLHRALSRCSELFAEGQHNAALLSQEIERVLSTEPQAKVDYVAIVSIDDLEPVETIEKNPVLVALAVWIGKTRLIDNVVLIPLQS